MASLETEAGYATPGFSFWNPDEDEKTPELRWPLNVDIYDTMRRQDAQVISVLRAVTLPIRRTEWRIDANGAPAEVAQFVAENLNLPLVGAEQAPRPVRTRDRFSWQEHLRLALLMLTFGHSFFEQTYRYEAGRFHLRKLGWRPPRTIAKVDVAADGGLVAIEQHGTGPKRARMKVDRIVAYTNDREGGNWLGASLLRPAYKFWILKDRLLRVGAQTVDRNGMGVPVYKSPPAPERLTGDELEAWQKDELKRGLDLAKSFRSGNQAGAAISHGAEMELLGVKGTLPDADKPIRYYDEQIARAVLAHFLNLGTETGSWALGSTFAEFFTLSLQTVANQIADVATQHIVEDLVDINFGTEVPAPRVVFDEIGSRHPVTADAVRALIECRALTADDELETYLRTVYGLPAHNPSTARKRPEEGENATQTAAER